MKTKSQSGFTIIELMLTIAVAGALLAVGIPSYVTMVKNNCLTTKTNAIISAMQLARSTAITVRDDVTISAICNLDDDNNGVGDGSCLTGDEFGAGVVVFRDIDGDGFADSAVEDANGSGTLDAGEDVNGNGILDYEIVRIIDFTCDATVDETAGRTSFTYQPTGTTTLAAGGSGILNICDDRVSSEYKGRQLTLNALGRPHTDADFTCP